MPNGPAPNAGLLNQSQGGGLLGFLQNGGIGGLLGMPGVPGVLEQMVGHDQMAEQLRQQNGGVAVPPGDPRMTESGMNLAGNFDFTGALPGGLLGSIKAYHGSPHAFDRFDMGRIGTGEGAQAYGHGLYFAENEGIARHYRDALGQRQPRNVMIAGKDVDVTGAEIENLVAARLKNLYRGDMNQAVEDYRASLGAAEDRARREGYDDPQIERQRKALDAAVERGIGIPEPGHLYTADLDVNHEDLLDWDKPLSEAPRRIEDAVADLVVEHGIRVGDATGARVYQELKAKLGDSGASVALRAAGIPGIRYLDAGSRGAGEGSRNIVLFDDKRARILERNGQPVASP